MATETIIPSKFWFRTREGIEIDVMGLRMIMHHQGWRRRGGTLYRFVADHRQVIQTTKSAYFDEIRSMILDDFPDSAKIIDALEDTISLYGWRLISQLQTLEMYYQSVNKQ